MCRARLPSGSGALTCDTALHRGCGPDGSRDRIASMKNSQPPNTRATPTRIATLILVAATTVAVTGFFLGTSNRDALDGATARSFAPAQADNGAERSVAIVAPRYIDRPRRFTSPNVAWKNDLTSLHPPAMPAQSDARLSPMAAEIRAEVRRALSARRAFDGAPPVVPHPIDQMSVASCIACHGEGLVIGGRAAPKISHPLYASCTQCHIEANVANEGVRAAGASAYAGNTFLGRKPAPGSRAYPGAPPTVPHSLNMRNDCLACHGPERHEGLQTTHPWRQSCTQCHAPSADAEPYPFIDNSPKSDQVPEARP